MNKILIGKKLREFLISKFGKLTIAAEKLEMRPQNLNTYLNGEHIPGGKLLNRLNELGCDTEFLFNTKDYYNEETDNSSIEDMIKKTGLKQRYVADKFNISEEYLSKIINGKRKGKNITQRIKLFLHQYENENQKINIDLEPKVSEDYLKYSVKDKIILSQAEEIFLLKKQLLDLSEKLDELEKESGDMLVEVKSKELNKAKNKTYPKKKIN